MVTQVEVTMRVWFKHPKDLATKELCEALLENDTVAYSINDDGVDHWPEDTTEIETLITDVKVVSPREYPKEAGSAGLCG